jgi:hypothetical protein
MRRPQLIGSLVNFLHRDGGSRSRRALGALLAVLVAGTALADYGPILTVEGLTDTAAAVVRGRVHSVDSGWDQPAATIYTYVAIDVDRVLRGDVPHERIVVKQLGGIVGDVGLSVGGQPDFTPGEEVVVFLHVRPRDNTLQTANFWQGKWSVQTGPEGEVAVRHAGLDEEGAPVDDSEIDLDALESRVRARQSTRRSFSAGEIVFHPAETPEPVNTVGAVSQKIPFLGFSWHQAFAGGTIPFNFHKEKHPKAGLGKKQLQNSWKDWSSVRKVIPWPRKGKKIRTPAPGTGQRPGDASIMLQNGDPLDEIADSSTTLAVGGAWFFSGPLVRGLGPAFSGFVVVQDEARAVAFMADKTCYETVIKHEVGHAAGLGHSDKAANLMWPGVGPVGCNAGIPLGKDDMKFYRKEYHKKFRTRTGSE